MKPEQRNLLLFDPPISRRSDPDTSKAAEVKHTLGKRAERQWQVLRMVGRFPHKTSGEYSRLMLKLYPTRPVRSAVESPHKRLSDLIQKGLVVEASKRVCTDSGYECATYTLTTAGFQAIKDAKNREVAK